MLALGIIDVQKDFMNKDGALYVPGAEIIKEKIKKLVQDIRDTTAPIFFTADEHDGTEPEMAQNGGLFPLHCIKGTEGQKNIEEADPTGFSIFTKRCYDVFDKDLGNSNIDSWLKENKITAVWLAGVVGNICVEAAAIGLLKRGIKVYLMSDHIVWMDLGVDNNKETSIKKLRELGAMFI